MSEMIAAAAQLAAPRFTVRLAVSTEEVRAAQRLRYEVFADELGADLGAAEDGGQALDQDRFDPYCRHLLVLHADTGAVVACTRLLSDAAAAACGSFYSESEFDLRSIHALAGRKLEIGRTCVAAAWRTGAVIARLWQGVAEIVVREGFDYLFGCASIDLRDGGHTVRAVVERLRPGQGTWPAPGVRPHRPLPARQVAQTERAEAGASVRMPPLLKAYVSLGAKACGEPCWDRDFNCADVFMLLRVAELEPRYARHFLQRAAAPGGSVAEDKRSGLAA